jgi:hypothetical protein
MLRLLLLLLIGVSAVAQPNDELQEYTGTVLSFEPGYGFIYDRLNLDVSGSTESFVFYPEYGKLILGKLKPGDPVTLKVRLNLLDRKRYASRPEAIRKRAIRDHITAFKTGNEWTELPGVNGGHSGPWGFKMFLECEVKEEFWLGGLPLAFVFGNREVGHSWAQHKKPIKKGDIISFLGTRFVTHPGFAYPIPDAKAVYGVSLLVREEGVIK